MLLPVVPFLHASPACAHARALSPVKIYEHCSKVAGNYQYQWARRILCDPTSTLAGGMDKEQLKLRLSGLLGVELSDGEMDVLFHKHADP